ncbi:TIGR03086 family metal-binding protein [Streptomyces sp. WMMB 322]|uniref:TIGR03086 family metal-binding protein n=1 Tax=Streptomyces sp. WMMB 322 TaxID=1286821 RepID=UPI0006E1C460|nr:TIGR03086 family metal-binding protein [Streptomyces sp. WMMB 322]SCK10975.1 TIGR03086 family protein [Streptomyces sp. WMMB 322]
MDDGTRDAGTALLERALGYALCAVRPVTAPALNRATPCGRWDLRALLWHTNDSLAALCEGIEDGHVALEPPAAAGGSESDRRGPRDPAAAFRAAASRLMGAWAGSRTPARRLVAVDDLPLTAAALARTGALEIAVHGWDIAQAIGLPRPVPAALATELIRTARQLVPGPEARHPLFAPPVTVPAEADPSDRLVAFLGRDPYRTRRGEETGGTEGRTEPA